MKDVLKIFVTVAILVAIAMPVAAQTGPCLPDGYRTQTQGGWGAPCSGNNVGCIRDNNFDAAFLPGGLIIGGIFTITFTSANAVEVFLATGGMPDQLTQDYVDPVGHTDAGVFAGQVTACALSMGFANLGVPGFGPLWNLYYLSLFPHPAYPFSGWTVQQLCDLANEVLGGNSSNLPAGTSISDLNNAITIINENFVGGEVNLGKLVEENCDYELPVELTGFDAIAGVGEIMLQWNTASENSVESYTVERSRVSGQWMRIATVAGLGDSPSGHEYSYTDRTVETGVLYSYRLTGRDLDGSEVIFDRVVTASATGQAENPTEFALHQNYPNPFNPETSIAFNLVEGGFVSLTVYNLLGQEVASLVNGTMDAGRHVIGFSADNLTSGVYLYRIEAGDFSAMKKMVLMR